MLVLDSIITPQSVHSRHPFSWSFSSGVQIFIVFFMMQALRIYIIRVYRYVILNVYVYINFHLFFYFDYFPSVASYEVFIQRCLRFSLCSP